MHWYLKYTFYCLVTLVCLSHEMNWFSKKFQVYIYNRDKWFCLNHSRNVLSITDFVTFYLSWVFYICNIKLFKLHWWACLALITSSFMKCLRNVHSLTGISVWYLLSDKKHPIQKSDPAIYGICIAMCVMWWLVNSIFIFGNRI